MPTPVTDSGAAPAGARDLSDLLTCDDFEAAASAVLPQAAYDYYRSGADAERTVRDNLAAYGRWRIWPRVLRDVSHVNTRLTLLGADLAAPILVAPTAYHRLAHPDGERATAQGAAAAGALLCVSTLATTVLEEVAAASSGPKWFQLYVHRDRGFTRSLVERAATAGYQALALTVDTPLLGRRLRDERNRFALPPGLVMANLVDAPQESAAATPTAARSSLAAYCADRHDASLGFEDLAWLANFSPLPVLVKGVLRADDATRALDAGAAGLIVSNHGGRQLDGVPATLDALPEIAAVAAGRCPVLLDGGVRWGSDVLTALCLGADAVMVGRPVLYGLAAGGAAGVERVLTLLKAELVRAMALAGCPDLGAASRDLLRRP